MSGADREFGAKPRMRLRPFYALFGAFLVARGCAALAAHDDAVSLGPASEVQPVSDFVAAEAEEEAAGRS